MKFRNFGKKSLTELDELVAIKNLNFGMDLAKYKLDKRIPNPALLRIKFHKAMRHGKKFNHLADRLRIENLC
jgi:hypothetical protein